MMESSYHIFWVNFHFSIFQKILLHWIFLIFSDFYTCLVEATSTKYTINQVNNIIFQIITDACKMCSLFVGEIYKALVNLSFEQQLEFIGNNLKLVTRFIKMFRVLMRFSEICFSVLNFFGDSVSFHFFLILDHQRIHT